MTLDKGIKKVEDKNTKQKTLVKMKEEDKKNELDALNQLKKKKA